MPVTSRVPGTRGWAAGTAAVIFLLGGAACREPDAAPVHRTLTEPLTAGRAVATSAQLHQRNPLSWIGVNHNKFLELFRAELVAHGAPPGGICDIAVKVILAHPELLGPGGIAVTSASGARGAIRAACLGAAKVEQSRSLIQPTALLLQSSGPSPAAQDLTNQVHTVAYQYTDPTSFSTALSPILDTATTLPDSMDVQYVQGDVSTAQSSVEYWMDPTDEANEQASFMANYGPCIQANLYADYESICLGLTQAPPASFRRTTSQALRVSFASYSPPKPCAGMDWYEVGGADITGFTGGVQSDWEAGPQVALATGLTVGAAASAGMSWWQLGHWAYCYYMLGGT